MRRKLFALITLGALGVGVAQGKDPFGKTEPPRKPNIKEIAPGILQVGTVRLEKKTHEIHLPVTINMNEGPLESTSLRTIYREVVSASIALQKNLVIGYLGPEATFTQQAAMKNFGSALSYRPLLDITDVFREVERGECEWGGAR